MSGKRRPSSPAIPPAVREMAAGLFPHQVEGLAFLLGRRQAILADDMGLGKTRQAIVALKAAVPDGSYLIVCPASVKLNWRREIRLVDPQAIVHVLDGSPPPASLPGWTIINYDILRKHLETLARVPWAGTVFDEAHYLKNHTSQRSRHARQLVQAAGSQKPIVYCLTGTPLTNRPRDLFPLLQLVGHSMGRSFLSFARRYCDAHHNGYGWVTDGASNLEELTVQLQGVMLRRSKGEVLNLPPKLRTWLPVEVPEGTARRETRKVLQLLLEIQSRQAGRGRDQAKLLALLTQARHQLARVKVPAALDLVQGAIDQGEKVLVFSCFDEPVQRIADHFGHQAVRLTGATPANQRQALVDRFQYEEGVRVFVATLQAGGVGLNLTAARQVVFTDLDWVPANHWQAEDRAYRIGQVGTVQAHYLVAAGTLDDFVRQVLEVKAELIEAVVDGGGLEDGIFRDVLPELERLLGVLSPRLADRSGRELNDEDLKGLLEEAATLFRQQTGDSSSEQPARLKVDQNLEAALRTLAKVLSAPRVEHYRVASSSDPGKFYELSMESSGDLECSCPGFSYRGMCRHARELKAALSQGHGLPTGFSSVQ